MYLHRFPEAKVSPLNPDVAALGLFSGSLNSNQPKMSIEYMLQKTQSQPKGHRRPIEF